MPIERKDELPVPGLCWPPTVSGTSDPRHIVGVVISLLSWNIHQLDLYSEVLAEPVDLALLQEAPRPPRWMTNVPGPDDPWKTAGWEVRPWRTMIVRVSDRVAVVPRETIRLGDADWDDYAVSRPGTIDLADVLVAGEYAFTVASVYCPWERPPGDERSIYSDASAHRILSDLSQHLTQGNQDPADPWHMPLIVAGDWNILHGYGEDGDPYWGARYASVFDRAEALGLSFVGPKINAASRQADPWPVELPSGSRDVPTFRPSGRTPGTESRQLDFVFASRSIADKVTVTALNRVEDWGPSDHCRINIDIAL